MLVGRVLVGRAVVVESVEGMGSPRPGAGRNILRKIECVFECEFDDMALHGSLESAKGRDHRENQRRS
ncbi:hypothetical protein CC117_31785 [Parafrankia colletiae]|uniref:Uncharacterized protein n=1 Tax=Parafrankia colletiae TaxID=573497 RepID=A0A1S1RFX7_9ACTN|nr:hypothetical protein CC117_31785 [Parafrankia colletiae]